MKLSKIIARLVAKHTLPTILNEFLKHMPWEQVLQTLCNQCIINAYGAKTKKKSKEWYHLGRLFHRAMDEIKAEKGKKKPVFRVARVDVYECKCKKRFKVDAAKQLNCKFDLGKGTMLVTCPNCGRSE